MGRLAVLISLACLLPPLTWATEEPPLRSREGGADGAAMEVPEEATSGTFSFADINIFYQTFSSPPDAPIVLLLHGQRFTSNTWLDIGTLKVIRQKGYKPLAIDLPGYGKTPGLPYQDNNLRAEIVKAAFDFASGGRNVSRVLVSPSMSGKFAIPFLDRYGASYLKGWVAVAPVGLKEWGGPWELAHKNVQVLAIYGSNDTMLSEADLLMKMFIKARKVLLDGAGHACYLDQTQEFHTKIMNFVAWCFTPPAERDL